MNTVDLKGNGATRERADGHSLRADHRAPVSMGKARPASLTVTQAHVVTPEGRRRWRASGGINPWAAKPADCPAHECERPGRGAWRERTPRIWRRHHVGDRFDTAKYFCELAVFELC